MSGDVSCRIFKKKQGQGGKKPIQRGFMRQSQNTYSIYSMSSGACNALKEAKRQP